jgi:uncharacterized protein YlzI (FlbEa/FlbD family)
MTEFIELHRQVGANAGRTVWVNHHHIAVIADEPDSHARLRLCDAMVVDVAESPAEVLDLIEAAGVYLTGTISND